MKIKNDRVYDLKESIKASGYPMLVGEIPDFDEEIELNDGDWKRVTRLGTARPSSGHDNFLSGIVVNFDLVAPQYFWPQFQRYHFAQIVSSQSKMHQINNMNLEEQCNEFVSPEGIAKLQDLTKKFNADKSKENFQELLSNVPMGLNLGARISTNYLQLKTTYRQRKNHRLPEWTYFTNWVEDLPYFKEIALKIVENPLE